MSTNFPVLFFYQFQFLLQGPWLQCQIDWCQYSNYYQYHYDAPEQIDEGSLVIFHWNAHEVFKLELQLRALMGGEHSGVVKDYH